jgi:hypothetical protein
LFFKVIVSKHDKEKIMAENMMSETVWNWSKTFSDTGKAFADSTMAAQERNLRYGQSVVENGLEVWKSHMQATRSLTDMLVGQSYKQQETFQNLTHEAVEAYMGMFSKAFSYYRRMFDSTESMALQGVDMAQKAIRESVDVAQAAMQQGQKIAQ